MSGANEIIEKARAEGRDVLTEAESKELLRGLGIRTTQMRPAASREEAVAVGREVGYPCVLKVASPDITHKSDAGGVKVGLADEAQVAEAYDAIMASCRAAFPEAVIEGVTVQDMAPPGLEVIVGMATDPQFGPVVMFGLGGVWVEVLKDVSFRLAPLTRDDARAAIGEIRAARLLEGFRGSRARGQGGARGHPPQGLGVRRGDAGGPGDGPQPRVRLPGRRRRRRRPRDPRRVTMSSQTVEQLTHICNAESVALVGASDKEGSFGRLFLEGLRDAGCRRIYPVNPKREEILGIKAYPSISAVPDQIDLAILLTPTGVVLDLVKECVQNKVGGAIVFASGFGELGAEGKALEREIGRVGREGGTRVIGPNCIGLFNPQAGRDHVPAGADEGRPQGAGVRGRVLPERLLRRLPRLVPRREGPALQHHRELRQRVRPGRRGLPRVLRPGRADQDHRRLHGGRQGRPALLRSGA